jgi:hypothetical protein
MIRGARAPCVAAVRPSVAALESDEEKLGAAHTAVEYRNIVLTPARQPKRHC